MHSTFSKVITSGCGQEQRVERPSPEAAVGGHPLPDGQGAIKNDGRGREVGNKGEYIIGFEQVVTSLPSLPSPLPPPSLFVYRVLERGDKSEALPPVAKAATRAD